MKPLCNDCLVEFSPKRYELGYRTCLDCGATRAVKDFNRNARCTAPAYNKGGYMYISSVNMAKDVGR